MAVYLEDVNTLSSDLTNQFVFVIEMSAVHLRRFVHSVLNFDGHATTCLRLLDNL